MNTPFRKGDKLTDYMIFPRFLLKSGLSSTAMLTYVLLFDRTKVSLQDESWADDEGRVFVVYPIEKLAEKLGKSSMTVKNALAELERADLLERKRCGIGKPNHIFLKAPVESFLSPTKQGNFPCDGQKIVCHGARKLSTNKNKESKNKSVIHRNYECEENETL